MKKLFLIATMVPFFNILNASDTLCDAVSNSNLELLKSELRNGANPNCKYRRNPILHRAVEIGNKNIIKELLKFGADAYHCGHCRLDNLINTYMFDISATTWFAENDQKDYALTNIVSFSDEDKLIIFRNWLNQNRVKTFSVIKDILALDTNLCREFFDAVVREKISNMLAENSDIEWKNLYELVRNLDTLNFGLLRNRSYSDIEIITVSSKLGIKRKRDNDDINLESKRPRISNLDEEKATE